MRLEGVYTVYITTFPLRFAQRNYTVLSSGMTPKPRSILAIQRFTSVEPISFSSRDEKKNVEHLEQFQQRHTFPLWMRKLLKGASGRVGLFVTWTGCWVCQTKVDFKRATRHVWAAVLTKGKLVIFDSNSDFLPEDVTGNDLWLHRQRGRRPPQVRQPQAPREYTTLSSGNLDTWGRGKPGLVKHSLQ